VAHPGRRAAAAGCTPPGRAGRVVGARGAWPLGAVGCRRSRAEACVQAGHGAGVGLAGCPAGGSRGGPPGREWRQSGQGGGRWVRRARSVCAPHAGCGRRASGMAAPPAAGVWRGLGAGWRARAAKPAGPDVRARASPVAAVFRPVPSSRPLPMTGATVTVLPCASGAGEAPHTSPGGHSRPRSRSGRRGRITPLARGACPRRASAFTDAVRAACSRLVHRRCRPWWAREASRSPTPRPASCKQLGRAQAPARGTLSSTARHT
jgi:hypothetical protein